MLRWRDSDRASSNGHISEGEKVTFLEEKGTDWFKVKQGDNEGYVRRGELTSVSNYNQTGKAEIHDTAMADKESFDKLVVTIDVNLRTKDETQYRPITLLKKETELTYKGTTKNDWFKVEYNGQEGYVYRGDVTSKKNWEDQDKTIHTTDMAKKEDFAKLEVLMDVNLRTKDDTQYRPIELLTKGQIVHYQGTTEKNWFKVKTLEGQEGYVYRGDLTKYEDLEISKDTILDADEAFVNVTKNDAVLDLGGHTVGTLAITANDTTIKNGQVNNIKIGEDVENVILEDVIDDGQGNHDFAGGGANSIVLKGKTNLKSPVGISSAKPIQIRSENLTEGNGLKGKVSVETESAVTVAVPVEELEVKKANKEIKIKAEVKKVSALAETKITVAKDVKTPKLEKAKGVKESATDSTGKEEEFEENENLEPTEPVEPEPEPEPTPPVTPPTPTPDPEPLTVESVSAVNERPVLDDEVTVTLNRDLAQGEKVTVVVNSEDAEVLDTSGENTFTTKARLVADKNTITVTLNDEKPFIDKKEVVVNSAEVKDFEEFDKAITDKIQNIKLIGEVNLAANYTISLDNLTIDGKKQYNYNNKSYTFTLEADSEDVTVREVMTEFMIKKADILGINVNGKFDKLSDSDGSKTRKYAVAHDLMLSADNDTEYILETFQDAFEWSVSFRHATQEVTKSSKSKEGFKIFEPKFQEVAKVLGPGEYEDRIEAVLENNSAKTIYDEHIKGKVYGQFLAILDAFERKIVEQYLKDSITKAKDGVGEEERFEFTNTPIVQGLEVTYTSTNLNDFKASKDSNALATKDLARVLGSLHRINKGIDEIGFNDSSYKWNFNGNLIGSNWEVNGDGETLVTTIAEKIDNESYGPFEFKIKGQTVKIVIDLSQPNRRKLEIKSLL